MKAVGFVKSWATIIITGLLAVASADASVIYQDDFSANSGALSGRTTAAGFGSWTTSSDSFQVSGGQVEINSNSPVDYHFAHFVLPTLAASDILSVDVTVRPSGAGFMGIGFLPLAGDYLINSGLPWLYLTGLDSASPGHVEIFRGAGAADNVYSGTPAGFDAALPTTYHFVFDKTASTLSISAENGSTTSDLAIDLDVSIAAANSGFEKFGMQFQSQALSTDASPAYMSDISVQVIPEPATVSVLGLGALVTLLIRRYRCV